MVDFQINVVIDPSGAPAGSRVVERELVRLENRADRLRGTIGRAFGILSSTALAVNAVRTLAGFEQAMADVRAVTGATAEEFEVLTQKALTLGVSTRFSATQAATALADLARAGFSTGEALVAVGDTLLLAQAGGLGLAEATDIAASALRGFRLAADQTGRVADVLAAAANATNTSVGELGEGLKFVAPISAGLNVSLEQTAAAMGVLSDAGLKASLAGTGLRRVLSELESPSATSQRILARLGVSADEVRVSQVGLTEAIRRLGEAGLSTGAALEVFGDRGGPAFEVLAKNLGRVEDLTEAFNNTAGSAKGVAAIMDDNLNGSLLRVRAAFNGVILAVGKAGATGGLRAVLDEVAAGLRFLAANADNVLHFLQGLALFLGPRYLLGAFRALNGVILANPLGLFLAAIFTVASAIPDLQAKIQALTAEVFELGSTILSGFDFSTILTGAASAIDTLLALFAGIGAALGTLFDALRDSPDEVGELIKKGFRDAAEAVLDIFLALFQTIGNLLGFFGRQFLDVIDQVITGLRDIATGNLEGAEQAAANVEAILKGSLDAATKFPQQFAGNLKKLQDIEILPEVELSTKAADLGTLVSEEFKRAFEEASPTASQVVDGLLGAEEDTKAEAARRAAELALITQAAKPGATAAAPGVPAQPALSSGAQELLDRIDSTRMLAEAELALNEILRTRPDLLEEVNAAYLDAQIAALDASQAAEDGFTRAFLKLKKEAQDFASAAEAAVNAFADRATDALVEFALTGQFSFKEFANALLADITRIIARLLIVQALSAVAGGTSIDPSVVSGARADGGTVQPQRSYLVGEEGPELFVPGRTGTIVPNGGGEQAPPQVNVQVVNVTDPNEVPQAIAGGKADEAILNALARNPDRVKQVIS